MQCIKSLSVIPASITVMVQVQGALLLIHFLVDVSEKAVYGSLTPMWETMMESWLLAYAWSIPGCCGHLGHELENGRYLSVSLFLFITLPFK